MLRLALPLLFAAFFLLGKSSLNAQSSVITFEPNACQPVVFTSQPIDCSPDPIWLVSIAKTNCQLSSNLVWKWELDYNSDGTIDQKGNGSIVSLSSAQNLVFGKHTMKWFVSDDCGSVVSCVQSVELRDAKKPTPVTKLMSFENWTSDCKLILEANKINNFSWDNCTPMNELKFKVVRTKDLPQNIDIQYVMSLNDTLIFTPTDLGLNEIAFFAIDKFSNFDYVNTYIVISQPCTLIKTKKYLTCLDIKDRNNIPIGGVKFSYFKSPVTNVDSISPGIYCFPYHRINNLEIIKEDNIANGLTALDIIAANDYIIGNKTLDEYQRLSGDYNRDKKISTADVISIRNEILGIPSFNPTWNFVKVNSTAWDTLADEEHTIKGVRIGDITGNANPNGIVQIEENRIGSLSFVANDVLLVPNKSYVIPFNLTTTDDLYGFQTAIRPLNSNISIEEVNGAKTNQINIGFLKDGSIRMIDVQNLTKPTLHALRFTLKIKSTKLQYLSDAISNDDPNMFSEAYNAKDKIYGLKLKFVKTEVDPYTEKPQIVSLPNPFSTSTTLRFQSEQTESVDILIFNQLGQVVHQDKLLVYEGLNEYEYRHQSQTSELLYCKIVGKDGSKNGKMLFVKQ